MIITNPIIPNTHIIGINKLKISLQNLLQSCLIVYGYGCNRGTCEWIGIPIITTSLPLSFISSILILIFIDNSIQFYSIYKIE